MKSYPEMITEAEESLVKINRRIAELEAQEQTPHLIGRLHRLYDSRNYTLYGLTNMQEYLALHPELNDKEEPDVRKPNINWPVVFADIDGGMSYADAARKHDCAEVTILNQIRKRNRTAKQQAEATTAAATAPPIEPEAPPVKARTPAKPPRFAAALQELQRHIGNAGTCIDTLVNSPAFGISIAEAYALGRHRAGLAEAERLVQSLLDMPTEP